MAFTQLPAPRPSMTPMVLLGVVLAVANAIT